MKKEVLAKMKTATRLIHAGLGHDQFGSATVPIYQTSTFIFPEASEGARRFAAESDGFIYTRIGNPTIRALEEALALIEGGCGAVAVSSGMAAVSTLYMTVLSAGDHVVSTGAVYGPARSLLEKQFIRFGINASFVNTSDIEKTAAAIRPETKLLYIETPANPTLEITDIKACVELAKKHKLVLAVDNTFCTPLMQNPLEIGADVVIHSLTKGLNGHADIVGGCLVAAEQGMYDRIRNMMVNMGCNMDPHQAYLVLRGMRTLELRVNRAQENALAVARYLEQHDQVAWINYPGLASHPQHELVGGQMRGPGAVICFGLQGGYRAAEQLMNEVKLAMLAVSLGGVETLIQHPASMTHARMGRAERLSAGIGDDLVRLAVGIEDVSDIIADLEQALARIS